MFPRPDEHVPLLEQRPAVDTLRYLHGVTDECGIDLAIQKHRNEPAGIRLVQIDSRSGMILASSKSNSVMSAAETD
jgi:hypothetical protein